MKHLQYPIGPFQRPSALTTDQRQQLIEEIQTFPTAFRKEGIALAPDQLDQTYRPGGWTARQVIHHVPDSHMNAYIRFKWALTESGPTIKAYQEDRWAELPDTRVMPAELSFGLLDALHQRWTTLMHLMEDKDWAKTYLHPDGNRIWRLDQALALYAWHGKHHLGHLAIIREQ